MFSFKLKNNILKIKLRTGENSCLSLMVQPTSTVIESVKKN